MKYSDLTKVDLRSPVSASQNLIVWSHDALQISSASDHSTEETASVWPERVARGVYNLKVREHQIEYCRQIYFFNK